MNWWQRLRKRGQLETELDAELQFHFQTQVDENIRNGMSEVEARRRARIVFGGLDQVKEDCRDARGTRWIEGIAQDLGFAMRLLTRHRSFTLLAIVVLALGIGVNGLFFTLIEMICLRGLPLDHPDRIMYVATRDASGRNRGVAYRDFEDLRVATRSFTGIAAFAGSPMAIGDEGRAPDRFQGAFISADGFRLIAQAPILGREFLPEDDRVGAAAVVILGSRVWQERYGGDPSIIGRTIRVNGVPAMVIGVMPDAFKFPTNADIWQPLALLPELTNQTRDARTLGVFGRLVNGTTLPQARAELEAIASRLSRDNPTTNTRVQMTVVPINERYNGNITDPTWLAFVSAGLLVLLIACANVANLLLMRSAQRTREIALRTSLGATRRRVIRQLLAESLLLAALGGLFGLGLSLTGLRVVSRLVPQDALPYWMDFTMDRRVLAALTAICLATTFVFGLVPALHLSRTDVNGLLKDGGRASSGGLGARRWTVGFLTAQFALALVLLANLTLGFRLMLVEKRKDPPIDMSRLLTMSVALPSQKYRTPLERNTFYERLDESLRGIGPISSAAITSALPFSGASMRRLAIDGRPAVSSAPPPTVWILTIGTRYFETIGLPLVRGRAFDDRDGTAGHENVIMNQRFVEMYFPSTDPIGHRIRLASETRDSPAPWFTIIGTSPTLRQRAVSEPDPVVYLPYRAEPPAVTALIVRGWSEPDALALLIREEVRALDPDLPLYRVMTMELAVDDARWNGRVSNLLANTLILIAVGLAAVGLYAVTAYAVARRTQEIGIRVALGAQPQQVRWLVLRRAMGQLGLGLIFGLALTVVWQIVFGTTSGSGAITDPVNLTSAGVLLVVVSALACLAPMRRATRLDPVIALRYE